MSSGALYEVAEHDRGRRRLRRGPMAGCLGWVEDRWTTLTSRPIGLSRAKRLADGLDHHAVVTFWRSAEIVHDNGKAPRLPEGWVAP